MGSGEGSAAPCPGGEVELDPGADYLEAGRDSVALRSQGSGARAAGAGGKEPDVIDKILDHLASKGIEPGRGPPEVAEPAAASGG